MWATKIKGYDDPQLMADFANMVEYYERRAGFTSYEIFYFWSTQEASNRLIADRIPDIKCKEALPLSVHSA